MQPPLFMIGILTPSVDTYRDRRDFFARVIAGAWQAIHQRGGQMLVVLGNGHQLAWNRVDGWLVVTDPSGLDTLRSVGTPVVSVGVHRPDLHVPAVLADNRAGVRAAMLHLIDHGHTRIAFVGTRRYSDIEERYTAYVDTLLERGIVPDPTLMIDPAENSVEETYRACQGLFPALHYTAIICGTDSHAMGVLDVVRAAGKRVPEDLAIIGFDDVDRAQYLRPPLTTVHQNVEALGSTAVDLLTAQIIGGAPPPAVTTIPTVLHVRRSCGCRLTTDTTMPVIGSFDPHAHWRDRLARQLEELACGTVTPHAGNAGVARWPGSAVLVRGLDATLHGGDVPTTREIERACEDLVALTNDLEQVNNILALLEDAASRLLAHVPNRVDASAQLHAFLASIRTELMRTYQLAEQRESDWLLQVLVMSHRISAALFGEDPNHAQQLAWIQDTPAVWGCLGLWTNNGSKEHTELVVAGTYSRDGHPNPPVGSRLRAVDFPPAEFRPPCTAGAQVFSLLLPLQTAYHDWGVLNLWPLADAPYFSYALWAQLLGSALERASLLKMVNHLVATPQQTTAGSITGGHGNAHDLQMTLRHADVQLLFIERGAISLFIGGRQMTLPAGRLAVFWAAIPQHIVWIDPDTTYSWITIPLAWVLQHHLPDTLMQPLLYGTLVVDQEASNSPFDLALLQRWETEIQVHGTEGQTIALLEIEARLRRLARSGTTTNSMSVDTVIPLGQGQRNAMKKTEQMAQFIAAHYTEALQVHDIADAVGLNPSYAITLFRTTVGISLNAYLTQYRVAHAQRLLVTTDLPTAQIAFDSGFSSISQFYAVFKRACGQSPSMYRASPHTLY